MWKEAPVGSGILSAEQKLTFCSSLRCDAGKRQSPNLLSWCLRQLLEADAESRPHTNGNHSPDIMHPYIAAKLDALPAAFTLGDEKKYSSYQNRALQGQQQYACFILAELMHHESVSPPSGFEGVTSGKEITAMSEIMTGWVSFYWRTQAAAPDAGTNDSEPVWSERCSILEENGETKKRRHSAATDAQLQVSGTDV